MVNCYMFLLLIIKLQLVTCMLCQGFKVIIHLGVLSRMILTTATVNQCHINYITVFVLFGVRSFRLNLSKIGSVWQI